MSMTKKEAFEIIEMLANVYNMELNDTNSICGLTSCVKMAITNHQ